MLMRDKYIVGQFLVSVMNLLVMHYTLFLTCNVERQLDDLVYADNLMVVVFEVVLLNLTFLLIYGGRLRLASFTVSLLTLVWSFCNLVYSRFFYQYISFSAIGETMNLFDPFVLKCVVDGLKWVDIYFVISFLFSIYLYKNSTNQRTLIKNTRRSLMILCAIVMLNVVLHATYCLLSPNKRYASYIVHRIYTEQLASFCYSAQPVYSNFQRGSLRTLSYQIIDNLRGALVLSDDQKAMLDKEIKNIRPFQVCAPSHPKVQNVIFILVESYMSFTVDMKIGGEEVTPFLNSLKRDSSTYYNGNMAPNITLGESSDGQFIYMTGLLPLRSAITVTEAKKHSYPGLPKQLAGFYKMKTRMLIPTAPSMWNQDIMCKRYGVDELFSTSEYMKPHSMYLSDDQVFDFASSVDYISEQPFFSMVLTFSMHQPYINEIDPTFHIDDSGYSSSLNYYLNACHFTDKQLRHYFEFLKESHLYENSLIVIASDHHVADSALELPVGMTDRSLPLFIINSGIDKGNFWTGACNQLDLYVTILDILGVQSEWRGLGHSLLNPQYRDSLEEGKWRYSEWIIKSGFFDE